jgi:hypothetical protein
VKYSIDTSAILDGQKRYYPPDVFPLLWDNMDKLIENRELRASQEVLRELDRKDDQARSWAKVRPQLFVPIDNQIQTVVIRIQKGHPNLVDMRRNRSIADPWVIALAVINNACVITGENPSNNIQKPFIPDVCRVLNIRCINLLELIREKQWIFG